MPTEPMRPDTKITKQARRRAQREEQQRQEAQRRATLIKRAIISVIIGIVIIVSVTFFANRTLSGTTTTQPLSTATPVVTSASTGAQSSLAPAVDNVLCESSEQLVYHIHAHLSMYINGKAVPVSQNIGITDSCFYWLHTHDTSGIIHIESPTQKTYLLGNFFDLWQQQFSQLHYPAQLNQSAGWQVYVNGKSYPGNFRTIPLTVHTLITLTYKSPGIKPDTIFNWGDL